MIRHLSFLLFAAVLVSCQRGGDLGILEETLYVRNDGADMPMYVFGNGSEKTFIILVHGGPGGTGLEYRAGDYASALEEEFAMVYWDQRGQGMSHGKYDASDVTVAQMADDLLAVVKTVKAHYGDDSKVFVMGHSWGGMLGTSFMINTEYQKEVSGWIESNGAHDIPFLNRSAIALFIQVANEQIDAGNSVSKWEEILAWAEGVDTTQTIDTETGGEINSRGFEAEELLSNDGVLLTSEGSSSFILSPSNALTALLSGNYTAATIEAEVESTSLTSQLANITVPCLFLWGKYDFVVPPRLGQSAFTLVSSTDKELVIFQRSGHSPMDNEPEAFSTAVIDFVKRQ